MGSIPTTQDVVLSAVVERLIERVDGFTSSTCFLSLWPLPPTIPPAQIFCTVAPLDGQFDPGLHDGGGIFQTSEVTGVVVTVFSAMKLDRSGSQDRLLRDESRGLLRFKRRILAALSGHMLTHEGQDILRNYIAPLKSPKPDHDPETGLGYIATYFSTDFDWDLGAEPEE